MSPAEWVEAIGPESLPRDVAPLLDHAETDESHLLRLLRKRELPGTVIEAVARHERWNGRRGIRAAIVMHGKTPRTLALRLLSLLLWRDQLRIATNLRLHASLRIAAEARLRERFAELELGEKISMARSAPSGLLPLLLNEDHPRVVAALLGNPRLGEKDVVAILRREKASSEVLRITAQSERWSSRPAIRTAILSHPATPVHTALKLLGRLPRQEVRQLLASGALPRIVGLSAQRILEGERPKKHGLAR